MSYLDEEEPDDQEHDASPFVFCPICGAEMERVLCWYGCDDGYFDEADADPINYAPGEEYTPCPGCQGRGSYWECPNIPHTQTGEQNGQSQAEEV